MHARPVYSSIEFRRSAASTGQPRVDESTKKAMKKGLVKKSSPSWGAVSVGSACVDIEFQASSPSMEPSPIHWLISTQGSHREHRRQLRDRLRHDAQLRRRGRGQRPRDGRERGGGRRKGSKYGGLHFACADVTSPAVRGNACFLPLRPPTRLQLLASTPPGWEAHAGEPLAAATRYSFSSEVRWCSLLLTIDFTYDALGACV